MRLTNEPSIPAATPFRRLCFAIVRHIALNLLKDEQSKKKRSIKTKRKRCGWDHDYILRVIGINTL